MFREKHDSFQRPLRNDHTDGDTGSDICLYIFPSFVPVCRRALAHGAARIRSQRWVRESVRETDEFSDRYLPEKLLLHSTAMRVPL